MKTIIDFTNKVKSLVDGRMSNIANVETSPSTHPYAVGKQLIFNGLLCKATSAIAVGDTLAVGTNLALSDNVVEQIYSLNQGLTNSLNNFAPSYINSSTYAVDSLVTYNGKFYQCIIAVNTPEQFDINKWDDVTTSEVYVRSKEIISRHSVSAAADTSVTNQQYLDSAFSSLLTTIKNSLGANQIAIIISASYDYLNLYPVNVPDITPTTDFTNSFFNFDGLYANTNDMYRGNIRKYVNESFLYFGTHFTGATVSYSDKSSDNASDKGLILDYYIISTRS